MENKELNVENLKSFMGDSYKEDLTLEDVNSFLNGKKYADLSKGGYVDKAKYDALVSKHNETLEKEKSHEEDLKELETFRQERKLAELKKTAESVGIDERYIKFALSEIDPQAEDKESALKDWLKENPQFGKEKKEIKKVIISSNKNLEDGKKVPTTTNQKMNSIIRGVVRK